MIFDDVHSPGPPFGFKMSFLDVLPLETAILEAGDGDYLEIGVRLGGSAIFAGLVKRAAKQEGSIYGIDNFSAKVSGPEIVSERAARFGVSINLTVADSDPWPLSEDIRPVVAVIDGCHSYDVVLADWNNLRTRTKRFILFHDYTTKHVDVGRAVEIAKEDKDWRFIETSGVMALFERRA